MEKPSPECRDNDLGCLAVANGREMIGAAYPSNCSPPENVVGATAAYFYSAVNCSPPGNQLGATAPYCSTLESVNCSPPGRLLEVAATTSNNICMGLSPEFNRYSSEQLEAAINEHCRVCTSRLNPEGELVGPDGERITLPSSNVYQSIPFYTSATPCGKGQILGKCI